MAKRSRLRIVELAGLVRAGQNAREIVDVIQRETANRSSRRVRERLREWVNEPVAAAEEFDAFFRAEVAKFGRVVKDARIPTQE